MSAFGTLAIATTGAWALVQSKNTLQNQRADEMRQRRGTPSAPPIGLHIIMNDIFKNWISRLRGSRAPVASNVVETANLHFRTPWYQRHNQRRQEHLASLQLDLVGKSVLEVGAGVGDHTYYFLDRDCTVVSVEARRENCQSFGESMQALEASGYSKASRWKLVQGDVESLKGGGHRNFRCRVSLIMISDLEGYVSRRLKELTAGNQRPMMAMLGTVEDFPIAERLP